MMMIKDDLLACQRRKTRKDNSMKPEICATAQSLLQLKNLNKEEELMGSIDKFKVQGGKEDQHGGVDDEESKSEMSYVTDDSSDMETTMAEINAAQLIMQLCSSNSQQHAAGDEDEEKEETIGYYNSTDDSSGMVSSKRKDFEEINVFLPRKRNFRSLAELYEVTQPLEEDPYFD